MKWWQVPLIILIVLLALPVMLIAGAVQLLFSLILHVAIWILWCARGRDVLFVTSDSPVWGAYVTEKLLPRLGERAVILNWSERKKWSFSLARIAFYHFGGQREFNPLAVVFRPFRRPQVFRFWRPFRDWKHGNRGALQEVEREFLQATATRPPRA